MQTMDAPQAGAAEAGDEPPVLWLRGVGKTYAGGEAAGGSLKETLLALMERSPQGPVVEALSEIDLELRPGEVLGIVGANGSGKSTLLRLMAGIAHPTRGRVESRGRVIAMIELGAGFNRELDGEENTALQGAIYGMDRAEVRALMDPVFEFAGLNDFRRTPLKFYSSGMTARLGFAIAVHCDPDVLLVDEVLAVGDQEFQEKCLAAIARLRRHGTAVVFVTHAMDLAERICGRIIWLRRGRIAAQGPSQEVLAAYEQDILGGLYGSSEGQLTLARIMAGLPGRFGSGEARIRRVRTMDAAGRNRRNFAPGEGITIVIECEATPEISGLECSLTLDFERGMTVSYWASSAAGCICKLRDGHGEFRLTLDAPALQPGHYTFTLAITPPGGGENHYDLHFRIHHFTITDAGDGAPGIPLRLEAGISAV